MSKDKTLFFELQVFDGRDTSSVRVSVVIRNKNTSQEAQFIDHAITVNENQNVTIGAIASDADGDTLRYEWQQTLGPSVTLLNTSTLNVSFVSPSVDSDQTIDLTLYVYDSSKEIAISTRLTIVDVGEPSTAPPEADDSGGGTLSGAYLLLLALIALRRKSASYIKKK